MDHSDVKLNRRIVLGGGVSGAAVALAGCNFTGDAGGSSDGNGNGDADGGGGPSGTLRLYFSGATIDSLDPHYVNNAMIVVPSGLLEGLVFADDESTGLVPASADSWDVSDVKYVFTFHMLKCATWSNGDHLLEYYAGLIIIRIYHQ